MSVLGVLGHGVGNVTGDDPVGIALSMVVSARAIGGWDKRLDVDLEGRNAISCCHAPGKEACLTIVGNVLIPLDVVIVASSRCQIMNR